MSAPKHHTPETVEVTVDAPAAGGETIARTDSGIVFVTDAIPGERVRVHITERKKSFARGRVAEVLEPSEFRVPDRRVDWGCPEVGGVEFAHVTLEHSRTLKRAALLDQFARIGRFDSDLLARLNRDLRVVAPEHDGEEWRTRVQLAVRDGRVGMFKAGSHDIVPVTHIPLAVPRINNLHLDRFDFTGAQRVEIAVGDAGGAVTVVGDAAVAHKLSEVLAPEWSVSNRAGGKRNRSEGETHLLSGTGRVSHTVRGVTFEIDGQGFWQVHPDAAHMLSREVVERVQGDVADLFCGAGLLSIMVARETGAKVWGVEGSAPAIDDARANAERAGVDAEFSVGRVEKLTALKHADTVVLDPPRAGLAPHAIDVIADSACERVVYVSCDGGTFSRDAKLLLERGFACTDITAFDLFPLTAHAETVASFDRV